MDKWPTANQPNEGLHLHKWPKQTEHLWGKWENFSTSEKYRICLHPACMALERKKV